VALRLCASRKARQPRQHQHSSTSFFAGVRDPREQERPGKTNFPRKPNEASKEEADALRSQLLSSVNKFQRLNLFE
jgi:hypothetical protein